RALSNATTPPARDERGCRLVQKFIQTPQFILSSKKHNASNLACASELSHISRKQSTQTGTLLQEK
ncbi:MAG: hypothetical protein J6V72_20900, partial [Kiritimatiellae bacterium]|nr:hypothetical protein [Kiritimatiellia bacterium]